MVEGDGFGGLGVWRFVPEGVREDELGVFAGFERDFVDLRGKVEKNVLRDEVLD
jgi:hypothetical protein